MNKYKIVAVILNYITWQDTIECVDSLLGMCYADHEVVIVENGSKNESVEELERRYDGNKKVYIVKSDINLGFARGNNLGIKFAKEKLSADFVYVANSDTVISDKSLYSQIVEKYYEEGIGVISPTVHKLDGSYHLPAINCDNIYKKAASAWIRLLYVYFFYGFNQKCKQNKRNKQSIGIEKSDMSHSYAWKKYVVQGCAYFLTPDFFMHYKCLYPKTFLYWEEINLLMYIRKANLSSILAETSTVVHKVGGITGQIFEEKDRMRLRESLKSGIRSIGMFFLPARVITALFN